MLSDHPHRRLNLLTNEWVLVSPHRTQRPWQGQTEKVAAADAQRYDPNCYLCPGNARAGQARNPQYTSTFVFDNDFPALYPEAPLEEMSDHGLLVARTERGEQIEAQSVNLEGSQHYVYNVGGGTPLVEWTASYGVRRHKPATDSR